MQAPDDRIEKARRHLAAVLAIIPRDVTEEMIHEQECTQADVARALGAAYAEVAAAFALLGGTDAEVEALVPEVAGRRLIRGWARPFD
jgi:hypothetical protein